jgi:hypothetical protein
MDAEQQRQQQPPGAAQAVATAREAELQGRLDAASARGDLEEVTALARELRAAELRRALGEAVARREYAAVERLGSELQQLQPQLQEQDQGPWQGGGGEVAGSAVATTAAAAAALSEHSPPPPPPPSVAGAGAGGGAGRWSALDAEILREEAHNNASSERIEQVTARALLWVALCWLNAEVAAALPPPRRRRCQVKTELEALHWLDEPQLERPILSLGSGEGSHDIMVRWDLCGAHRTDTRLPARCVRTCVLGALQSLTGPHELAHPPDHLPCGWLPPPPESEWKSTVSSGQDFHGPLPSELQAPGLVDVAVHRCVHIRLGAAPAQAHPVHLLHHAKDPAQSRPGPLVPRHSPSPPARLPACLPAWLADGRLPAGRDLRLHPLGLRVGRRQRVRAAAAGAPARAHAERHLRRARGTALPLQRGVVGAGLVSDDDAPPARPTPCTLRLPYVSIDYSQLYIFHDENRRSD